MSRANEYFSLVLAGVGGQGLVTMGTLLGEAAVIEGRNACMSSTYGTEARGSFTRTDVIVGDGEIDFIGAESPRLVLCLAQEALDRCLLILEAGDEDAIFLYDSGLVTPSPDIRANSACAPFARIASEMGRPGSANLVALGAAVRLTGAVKADSIRAAAGRLGEGAQLAVDRGYDCISQ